MIVNRSVKYLFQTLEIFDTNTSQFHDSLFITINDSGQITQRGLENRSRSHQGQI